MNVITMQRQQQNSQNKTVQKFDILQVSFVRFCLYLLVGIMFLYVGLTSFKLNVSSMEVSSAITLTGIGLMLFGVKQLIPLTILFKFFIRRISILLFGYYHEKNS